MPRFLGARGADSAFAYGGGADSEIWRPSSERFRQPGGRYMDPAMAARAERMVSEAHPA